MREREEQFQKKPAELTPEEERYLKRYRAELTQEPYPGGEDAAVPRALLLEIVGIACELHVPGVFIGDLIQEGNVAALLALSEPETSPEGIRRSVQRAMLEYLEEQRRVRESDASIVARVNRLREAIEELSDGEKIDFSVDELSLYLDMPPEEIEDVLRIAGEQP